MFIKYASTHSRTDITLTVPIQVHENISWIFLFIFAYSCIETYIVQNYCVLLKDFFVKLELDRSKETPQLSYGFLWSFFPWMYLEFQEHVSWEKTVAYYILQSLYFSLQSLFLSDKNGLKNTSVEEGK